jgi:hypothetical protein
MAQQEQPQAPQGWSKTLLYMLSGIIPIVGLALGIVYLLKSDGYCKKFGALCLAWGICFWPIVILVFSYMIGNMIKRGL